MLTEQQTIKLRRFLEDGLSIVAKPYALIASELGCTSEQVIASIQQMQKDGLVKRFGMIVRHHELGYCQNAMVVWDVPKSIIDQVANKLAEEQVITLCYQRPRVLPDWPYNLFCMIHAKSRDWVQQQLDRMIDQYQLHEFQHEVLFSLKRFKQKGGSYVRRS